MREVCFCGRVGDVEDREPVLNGAGEWVLRCPDCGHLDGLGCLPGEAGFLLWGEAGWRRERRLPEAA